MKLAFVLSGGGSLGALQVGALRALLERGIHPDLLVGCSVGALNALYLARELSLAQVDRAAEVWRQVTTDKIYPGGRIRAIWRLVTGQDSLHDNRSFYDFLQNSGCTPALTFGALAGAPLYVTATHLKTGRLHVFGDDLNDRVLDALMASTALIPLHPPWEVNGERYVDGGTVTPLPLRVALDRGATEIYALHLRGSHGDPQPKPMRGVAAHINQAVGTMLRLQAEHDLHLAEIARRVNLHTLALEAPFGLSSADFGHADALLQAGYEQALSLLDQSPTATSVTTRPASQWWHVLLARRQTTDRATAP